MTDGQDWDQELQATRNQLLWYSSRLDDVEAEASAARAKTARDEDVMRRHANAEVTKLRSEFRNSVKLLRQHQALGEEEQSSMLACRHECAETEQELGQVRLETTFLHNQLCESEETIAAWTT